MRRPPGLSLSSLLAALIGLTGCITPPAVMSGGRDHLPVDELPPDAVAAVARVDDESVLRGVFVPSDAGAPVVLHLLESGGSATHGTRGIGAYPYLERLADRGFASLVLDYRGVGMSDGDRSPHHLRADARAAWNEAVRRAGSPDRVIVRGVSIGSLAAASLLEDGARPGAVILVAPVRAETAARHFVRRSHGAFLGGAMALFLRDAGDTDLIGAVRECPSPLLVLTAEEDSVLPADERADVAAAVAASGGVLHVVPDETHLGIVLRMNELDGLEVTFLRTLFPGLPPAGVRSRAIPATVAGRERIERFVRRRRVGVDLALAAGRPGFPADRWSEELVVRWWRDLTWARADRFASDEAAALLDFSDPSGVDLDPRELPSLRRLAESVGAGTSDSLGHAERLVALAQERGLADRAWYEREPEKGVVDPLLQMMQGTQEARRGVADTPSDAPDRLGPGVDREDSLRMAVRLLLKGAGIPERTRDDATGARRVEVFVGQTWTTLRIPEPR